MNMRVTKTERIVSLLDKYDIDSSEDEHYVTGADKAYRKLQRLHVRTKIRPPKPSEPEEVEELEESDDEEFTLLDEGVSIMTVSQESNEIGDSSYDRYNGSSATLLKVEPDFWETVQIPSLDTLSLESSDIAVEIFDAPRMSRTSEVGFGDTGKFTNPLTGEELVSSEEEIDPLLMPPVTIVQEEDEQESEEQHEIAIDFIDDELESLDQDDDDQDFNTFLQLEAEQRRVVQIHVTDAIKEYELEMAKRTMLDIVDDFIKEIIKRVVEITEYVHPLKILRSNLDKVKLVHGIQQKLAEYDIEAKIAQMLDRKVSDYFRRKKMAREIAEDNPLTHDIDKKRYKKRLTQLDQLLGKEHIIQKKFNEQLIVLKGMKIDLQVNERMIRTQLYETMRKCILRDRPSFDHLKQYMDYSLNLMQKMRNEISTYRREVILKQHDFASLTHKLGKIEDLGGGLSMRDFDHLATQTNALSKKIEERNTELYKLHVRSNANIHIWAHIRDRQLMLKYTTTQQNRDYIRYNSLKLQTRNEMYRKKLMRVDLKREINEFSFQLGLLDKPTLMVDYDQTGQGISVIKSRIENLKHKYIDLIDRFHKMKNYIDKTDLVLEAQLDAKRIADEELKLSLIEAAHRGFEI